ncbi:MAG: zinc-dependent alcohol dehydrogenase family protein [Acidimicrobiia bacterium]
MRAAAITQFGQPLVVGDHEDPLPSDSGVVLRVEATGICRSDWHAWMGHESLPSLPHVPGHEMAGIVETVGGGVRRWRPGDRVTVPFSVGCGRCPSCRLGHLNTCDRPFTPGFTHWGSFAELVAIDHADLNLVQIPNGLAATQAAALGCRFITSFHALVDRGRLLEDEWLAVHGCGGVGLSAVMIGVALGAHVVAVDIDPRSLALAADLGADMTVDARGDEVVTAVAEATSGGAHVSVDAVGTTVTALNSIGSLRKRGRHVQIGLLLGEHAEPPVPMERVIMGELEILGSRGMPATDYPRVFELIEAAHLDLGRLVTDTVSLDGASAALSAMGGFAGVGVTVIDRF